VFIFYFFYNGVTLTPWYCKRNFFHGTRQGLNRTAISNYILCSWFRASWINVNNCPTRCDYIQFYYISADNSTCFATVRWRGGDGDSSTSADVSKYLSTSARCCN